MINAIHEIELLNLIEEMTPPFFSIFCDCIPYTKDKVRIHSKWENEGNGRTVEIRIPDEETHYVALVEVAQSNYFKHILPCVEHNSRTLFLKKDVEVFGDNKEDGKFILLEMG